MAEAQGCNSHNDIGKQVAILFFLEYVEELRIFILKRKKWSNNKKKINPPP
jgi:hypothetical protein